MDDIGSFWEFNDFSKSEARLKTVLEKTTGDERLEILNNIAWDLHDRGHFEQALPYFEDALVERARRGKPGQIQSARWSVARCLRSLGRYQDALEILLELEAEQSMTGLVAENVLTEISANQIATKLKPRC
jgi:tetratricopeptide (TPR) repeat protein